MTSGIFGLRACAESRGIRTNDVVLHTKHTNNVNTCQQSGIMYVLCRFCFSCFPNREAPRISAISGEKINSTGSGGRFGLSSDWRLAIQEKGDLRGEACMAKGKREEVREILEKRRRTPSRKKVLRVIRSRMNTELIIDWNKCFKSIARIFDSIILL